ncbi:MAG: hypothetical protein HQK92_11405 [Nitrospirae bacterium]|nr:hypothetical protein [Nitrospirota bacterium]
MKLSEQQYLKKTVCSWLGIDDNDDVPTMPPNLARLFLRKEEYESSQRDQWNLWEHSYSENYKSGKLWVPDVNYWLKETLKTSIPLWPHGYSFAICLTHDVDFISKETTFNQKLRELTVNMQNTDSTLPEKMKASALSLGKLFVHKSPSYPSVADSIEHYLSIEKKYKLSSSFFFTAYPLKKIHKYDCFYALEDKCTFRGKKVTTLDMIKEMKDDGIDIGLHGSYLSALDVDVLKEQKHYLEKSLGFELTSTRQHWLNYDIEKTPHIQHEAGFLADTTLGFNRNIGFRSGTALPYYHYDVKNAELVPILQVPLAFQDFALTNANSLEYGLGMAKEVVKTILDRIIETHGCASISFHPAGEPIHFEIYDFILNYCTLKGGWLASLTEIYLWWQKRLKNLNISF